ncbi:PilZ domain-containing protein [Geomonas subterranea]|uniref:PilZ domain-containing protein n=1 Tax=Geomonas subterranea TaxID=2847989 RepID=A0ABX8LF16_9BACT|nr:MULTISPECIES: PilZ domain-containing protein [Geomonas]QXE89292.1 PilZ domain-containing protein [Geomonas subterranea]QXM08595.1 PilZ domain-containing protein [Geomonas subterranea]
MHDARILIVANDTDAGNAYLEALARAGAHGEVAHSFEQMAEMAKERTYNGFLVDILTLVRCSKEAKIIAYESINLFPVLRVKWDARGKKIKLSPLEQSFSPDADAALQFFIDKRCRTFPARSLRRHPRKVVNLNLRYSTDPAFAPDGTRKSFTINLSMGGVFMHTMEEFSTGDTIWLRFLECADQTPIPATVCWSQRWGASRCIPGVGLRFQSLAPRQLELIERVLNPS